MGYVFDVNSFDLALLEKGLSRKELAIQSGVDISVINKVYTRAPIWQRSATKLIAVLGLPPIEQTQMTPFRSLEAELCDKFAAELTAKKFTVEQEYPLPSGRKVDIVAFLKKDVHYIIEAKVKDPLAGIGQLIADKIELNAPGAKLVLLLGNDCASRNIIKRTCESLNIEIWSSYAMDMEKIRSMMPSF